MKRKITSALALLLSVLMVISCMPLSFAASVVVSGTCGYNLTFSIDSDGVMTISGEGKLGGNSVYVGGEDYDWYEIFSKYSVKTLIIETGITSIGSNAFFECGRLESVILEDGIETIGDSAFAGCCGLKSITIPGSVKTIGIGAFDGCSGLESVTLPDGIEIIERSTFSYCSSLKSITIPESVETIGDSAFAGCCGLKSITIPGSVKTIGIGAFDGCSGLESVILEGGIEIIDDEAFSYCSSLKSITIPGSVKTIGSNAFFECGRLESVILLDGIEIIDYEAFSYCSSLKSITIPESVETIGNYAFFYCSSMKSITIPESVKTIGSGAFRGCSGLESVILPDSLTSIGTKAFEGCSRLTEIVIPACVEAIGDATFEDCGKLETVVINNPECQIGSASNTFPEKTIISGYTGSTAEAYAMDLNRHFLPLDGENAGVVQNHSFVADWKEVIAPTCEGNGLKLRSCTVCGEILHETVLAYGHSDGDGDSSCDVCGKASETAEEHTHNFSQQITKNATCTEAGEIIFICSCGETKREELAMLYCSDSDSDGKCDTCGYVFEQSELSDWEKFIKMFTDFFDSMRKFLEVLFGITENI